ncbi:LysR family transcriptional regulator [Paraburkholderia sp. DHOC27]|uniref:LysR family transcriptional regulator n=1 Tax=Paraburkholderia sp. DHOC27 TaxID=2303330 RepID=UPI0015F2FFFF|nr:LysR substrate-binding domain-containing protein [Paraburkholderia sp. DHOC27]
MNYHHAELLFHVLRARTLTDAAQALHISQPAVTKQLRLLEDNLGVRLFQKEGRKLVPTMEALLLAEEVERTRAGLMSLNALAMRLRSGVAGNLVVCAVPALAQALLPATLGTFRQTHPTIQVEIKVENSWRIMELAESQQIDLGICYPFREMRQVDDTRLLSSRIVCAVRQDDVFAGKDNVSLGDLRGRPVVIVDSMNTSTTVKEILNTHGVDRNVVCTVSTSMLACEIVLNTGAIALIDSLTASAYRSRGIESFQLLQLPVRPVSLLRPKLRTISQFSEAFVSALSQHAARFDESAVKVLGDA